jgi:hypothetical protein
MKIIPVIVLSMLLFSGCRHTDDDQSSVAWADQQELTNSDNPNNPHTAAVPEPKTIYLMALGGAALLLINTMAMGKKL